MFSSDADQHLKKKKHRTHTDVLLISLNFTFSMQTQNPTKANSETANIYIFLMSLWKFRSECNPNSLIIQIENSGQCGFEFHKVTELGSCKIGPRIQDHVLTVLFPLLFTASLSYWIVADFRVPITDYLFLKGHGTVPTLVSEPWGLEWSFYRESIHSNDKKFPKENFDFLETLKLLMIHEPLWLSNELITLWLCI